MARNWPLISLVADFTAGPPSTPGASAVSLSTPPLTARAVSTTRGRQYELGFVQAGTMSIDVVDVQEYLNPANGASPFNTGGNSVLPYRCVQLGAWWNSTTKDTTGNMLNGNNLVTGSTTVRYDPSFESGTGGLFNYAGVASVATSTAQAFTGVQSVALGFTAPADVVELALPFGVVPGMAYTVSVYVYVPASHTVTASWFNFPGALGSTIATATSTTTGAWQRLTMTGAPSSTVGVLQFKMATGTFPATVYVDAVQMEIGATASAFTATGPTYKAIYSGYIERYPSKWDSAGFRGLRPLEAVDALSVLSRTVINQSYAATIAADGPQVYIPYNDSALPQAVQRPTGGQQMVGYQQLGTQSASVNFGGDTFLDGSSAVSLVQQNANPAATGDNTMITYLGTRQGTLTMDPQSFTIEAWVKFTTPCAYFGLGSGESTIGQYDGPHDYIGWFTVNGTLVAHYVAPNGTVYMNNNFSTLGEFFPGAKWRYVSIVLLGANQFQFVLDDKTSTVRTFASTPPAAALTNFFVEASAFHGDPIANTSIANMAAYPAALTSAQRLAHYQRGIGYLGELSSDRVARLLKQYWSSSYVTDTGKTKMSADFDYNGRQLLSVLQDITDTEGGLLWVDSAGGVHADSRDYRYVNFPSSRYTFGENSAAGELPYVDVEYDYDPTYVYSEADLTAASGKLYKAVNSTSQTAYGQRILAKSMFMANDWDVNQAAQFYAQRYAKPPGAPGSNTAPRISKFTIEPGYNPALFDAALTLGIGWRITVKRRTSAGVVMSGDYYVEQVSHNINADTSSWSVDYQLSPVFNPQTWKLGDATNGVLGSTSVCVY